MIDTYPSLFWGYCFIWGLIVTYLVWLGIKLVRIERKLNNQVQSKQSHE